MPFKERFHVNKNIFGWTMFVIIINVVEYSLLVKSFLGKKDKASVL